MIHVYIGYDPREDIAYQICQQSMVRKSSVSLHVQPLVKSVLEKRGLYYRKSEPGYNDGVMIDSIDKRPFSTEFAFTRFLVPTLQKEGWALFCDCDFLFRGDLAELEKYMDPDYAALVVKHTHIPKEREKMDGCPQRPYPRKNWSSFILWNCSHPANAELDVAAVNSRTGRWLHGFSWLKDDEIGSLPEEWNWLEGWSTSPNPKAVHMTRGGPWFRKWRDVDYADEWIYEKVLKGS